MIHFCGQADIWLADKLKSPYYSLREENPSLSNIEYVFPTLVWETAYGEKKPKQKLACDAARYIACSYGYMQLTIVAHFDH
jgi:hypothetical protein